MPTFREHLFLNINFVFMHRVFRFIWMISLIIACGCRSMIQVEFAQTDTEEGKLAACNLARQEDKQARTIFPRAVKAMRKARLTGFEPDSVRRMIVSVRQLPDKLHYSNINTSLRFSEKDIVVVYAERWRNLDMWVFALPAELNPKGVDIPLIAFPKNDLEKAIRRKFNIRYKSVSESDFNQGIW